MLNITKASAFLLLAVITYLYSQDTSAQLWKYSIEDLMNLTVVTPSKVEELRKNAPGIISVVTREEIDNYGANSLFDVLDRVAGLYIYGSYYLPNNMITIRGDATSHYCTHVLILIDGRPFRSSKEGYLLPFIDAFPLGAVKRIEVLRGPGSTLYGTTAYAGAINVITNTADQQETGASFAIGSFGLKKATLSTGAVKKNLGISLATSFSTTDGWPIAIRDGTKDSLYEVFETRAPQSAFGVHTKAFWKNLSVNGYFGYKYQMNGYQLQKVEKWPELNLGTTHTLIDVGYKKVLNHRYSIDVNATYNGQYMWQPFDISAHDVREYGSNHDLMIEITNQISPGDKLHFTVGGLTTYNTGYFRNNTLTSDGHDYNVWTLSSNPDPFEVVPDYHEFWFSGYINATFTLPRYLRFVAGAHANKVPGISVNVVPRFGVVGNFGNNVNARVLYGQAFRQGDVFERFSVVPAIQGNAQLMPEKVETYEAQLSYTLNQFYLSVSGFHSRQENLINRANVSDDTNIIAQQFVNEGELRSRGIEAEGKINLNKAWMLNASFLYQQNSNEDNVSDLFGVPNLLAKSGLSYNRAEFSAGIFFAHYNYLNDAIGYTIVYPDANPAVESYNYLTLQTSIDLKQLFQLTLRNYGLKAELFVTNILNESIHYPEYGRRFVNSTPGRSGRAFSGRISILL